jgi:type IV pilus biogenesis/stability protein PilW
MKRTLAVLVLLPLFCLSGCSSTDKAQPDPSDLSSAGDVANPLYPFTLMRQGSVYMQQGRYDDALERFLEAQRLQPKNATVYNMAGLCYLKLTQYDLALTFFDRALSLVPSFTDARNNRGATYLALEQYRMAEVDFVAVLADNTYPHRWQVYYNLGMTYLEQNELIAAEENFRRAARAPQPVFNAFLRLAEILQLQGKIDEAVAILEEATITFNRPSASLALGRLLMQIGRTEEGRHQLEELVADEPSSPAATEARQLLAAP